MPGVQSGIELIYAARMRAALLLTIVGCGFTPGTARVFDAALDGTPDSADSRTLMWSHDPMSQISVPANSSEWSDFLAAHSTLQVAVPSGLWLMQDASGNISQSIGTLSLAWNGQGTPAYSQAVNGWARHAIKLLDGQGAEWESRDASVLPDMTNDAMVVLMYYEPGTTFPVVGTMRDIVYEGSGLSTPAEFTRIGLDSNGHFALTTGTTTIAGTQAYSGVTPLILKSDPTTHQQEIITNRETIGPMTLTLTGNTHGLLMGAASNGDPEGGALYLAAWYKAAANMTDTQLHALITSLGF